MQDDNVNSESQYSPIQPAPTSDILILGATMIGAPTGESISRNSLSPKDAQGDDSSTITLVREMAGLTPCALLEREGIKPNRRLRQLMSIGFALVTIAFFANTLAP